MIIEQYELRLTHQIIDTENGKSLGKLEPDYVTVFNALPNAFDLPKTEIHKQLLWEMEKGLIRGGE